MPAHRTITVREHEYLTPHKVKGRRDCHAVGPENFARLRSYILLRAQDGSAPVMQVCALPRCGEAVKAANYVGVVGFADGIQVEILPKVGFGEETEQQSRKALERMLRSVGAGLPFAHMGRAAVASGSLPLYELFIAMFAAEVGRIARRGLAGAYREERGRIPQIRGRLNLTKQTREIPPRLQKFHCEYDEFGIDRPENRLLRSALGLLLRRTRDAGNRQLILRLLDCFGCVEESTDYEADFALCLRVRETAHYSDALAWSKVFLRGDSFGNLRGGYEVEAILFPMERVFESYVAGQLKKAARSVPAIERIDAQVGGFYLFEGGFARLRPDIVATLRGGMRVVLDTKWKRAVSPKSISAADMYQMYAYGRKCAGPLRDSDSNSPMRRVILVYPKNGDEHWGDPLRSGDGVVLSAFHVDLNDDDASDFIELAELVAGADA